MTWSLQQKIKSYKLKKKGNDEIHNKNRDIRKNA